MTLFKDRLLNQLELLDMNQKELAIKAEITPATISRYTTGNRNPSAENAKRIASVLGVSVDWLIGISDSENKLSKKEKSDIAKDLNGIKQQLLEADELMFDGMSMAFGGRLKHLRNNKGITQQELADAMKVGRPTIAGYETKGKQPDYEKLAWLSSFFNVSIDYLLGNTDSDASLPIGLSKKEKSDIAKDLSGIRQQLLDADELMFDGMPMAFGGRLKHLRNTKGITQAEVSKRLNISRGTYAHYELDKREPNYEMLIQIANFFNVSIDYLLGRYNNNTSALSKKENLDIAKGLDEIKHQLLDADELMFDGKPMNNESIDSVLKALELGIEIVRIKNKENYNPNKNKK